MNSKKFVQEKAKFQKITKVQGQTTSTSQNFFTRTWNKIKNAFGRGDTKAPTSPQAAGKAAEENKP